MKTVSGGAAASTIGLALLAISLTVALLNPGIALSEDTWLNEFDAVCSQTGDAMDMTKDQLNQLLDRCYRLQSDIEKQDESTKKVYLKKLKSCRELYEFVIATKDRQ